MYAIVGFVCGFAMVASAVVNDINVDTVSDNDFVQIETFADYGGDIVPYVSDPYIEDNIPSDVVEEITVNQTVVDNTEVLERMDKLDSKLTLLNNSFNSVLSTSNVTYIQPTYMHSKVSVVGNSIMIIPQSTTGQYFTYVYDVANINTVKLEFLGSIPNNTSIYFCNSIDESITVPALKFVLTSNLVYSDVDVSSYNYVIAYCMYDSFNLQCSTTEDFNGDDTPDTPPSDPSGNDPSQPSINVTYPQEVIDSVKDMKKQLVTLTGVTLLNLIIPMFVSVFKRMVDPFKKRRE